MADRDQAAAAKSLHQWGVLSLKFQDAFRIGTKLNLPKSARPDNWCYVNGRAILIEVKSGHPSFAFDQWTDEQRQWALKYCIEQHTPYWIWLGLGEHSPARVPKGMAQDTYKPIQMYLLPWHVMIEAETLIRPYQETLAYRAKGALTAIQENHLAAPQLLFNYMLDYQGYNYWTLPKNHLFKRMYLDSSALPLPDAYLNMEAINGQWTGTAHRDSPEAIMQEIYHSSSSDEINKVPLLAKTIPYRRPGKGSRKALRQATGGVEQNSTDRNRESAAVNGASDPVGVVEPVGK